VSFVSKSTKAGTVNTEEGKSKWNSTIVVGWVKLLEFLANQERKEETHHRCEKAKEIDVSTGCI
jgi:hypothetical protein